MRATPSAAGIEAAMKRLRDRFDEHVQELQEFVRIPSVGAEKAHADDVRKAAHWLMARLESAGMEHIGLVETSGHPAVVADWLHAGDAPTVLVYGHYDVQPADAADGWKHNPWNADVSDGRIWGRGTTDDKGQLMCHVLAAEAWLRETDSIPVNLKMVFEGEEEMGSLHFDEVIDQAPDRLRADLCVVSDSPMAGEDRPALTTSLRGLVYLQVDVTGPKEDLHSGTFGGVLWNPLEALCHMLASCKDPVRGKVLVPGFYDDVVEATPEERERLQAGGESDEDILGQTGVDGVFGEEGYHTAERIGIRPTFEVNGIWGGYQGDGAKTVLPASAHAKLSCRLVADQAPDGVAAAIEEHLRAVAPEGVRVQVSRLARGDPVRADPDHPLVQAVDKALTDTFGRKPQLKAEGGSIPAVASLQNRLGAVPVLAGFGHRDENMHGPEESFRLRSFEKGQEAAVRMLDQVARVQG